MLHAKWFLRTQAVHGIYAMRQAGRQAGRWRGYGSASHQLDQPSAGPRRPRPLSRAIAAGAAAASSRSRASAAIIQ